MDTKIDGGKKKKSRKENKDKFGVEHDKYMVIIHRKEILWENLINITDEKLLGWIDILKNTFTFDWAAYVILRLENRPMTGQEITKIALEKEMLRTKGKTPHLSMGSCLYCDIRNNGENSRFKSFGPNLFGLRKWEGDVEKVKNEVIKEILSQDVRKFPDGFLEENIDEKPHKDFIIGEELLKYGRYLFGKQEIISDSGFKYEAENPVEAKFIIYSQRSGKNSIKIPKEQLTLFKTVKSYEIYLRGLKNNLFKSFFNRTLNHQISESLAKKVFEELNLPDVE